MIRQATVAVILICVMAGCAATPITAPRVLPPIEREILVPTPAGPLPGTFTAPPTGGRSPVVVIVHGSGPADRNLTFGPNAPYRDLAQGLAARGVASVRYDKRTKVAPFWFINRAFTVRDETIDDAVAALRVAREQPEVDPGHAVVLGHSLGGMLAPRIAQSDGHLAGIIIMAGATEMLLTDQLVRQMEYVASLPGADTAAVRRQQRMVTPMIERVRRLTPADTGSLYLNIGAPAMYWLDLAAYSSARMLRSMTIPALVMQGGRDYQVTTEQLDHWLTVLGSRRGVEVRRYPMLNHLFIAGTGPGSPAEYAVPANVEAQVLDDIAAWIRALPRVR